MRFSSFVLLAAVFLRSTVAGQSSRPGGDPCAKIAGKNFVATADARACLRSFPFNETLRQNILDVASGVIQFYTYEDFYLNSPPPFQDSTANISKILATIRKNTYETDYDLNLDLYHSLWRLNDGHTVWFPVCYLTFNNIHPLPIVSLNVDNLGEGIYVILDSVEFLSQLGDEFTAFYDKIGFNWKKFAGARVIEIEDMDPHKYIEVVAKTLSGNILDLGIRENSVVSSYRISGNAFSQRLGDFASRTTVEKDTVKMKLIPAGTNQQEIVEVPFVSLYLGNPFTDSASFWAANCAANDQTNGVDLKKTSGLQPSMKPSPRMIRGDITPRAKTTRGIALPPEFLPNLPTVPGSDGSIKSYILSDNKTGVMFVGNFAPSSGSAQFQSDVVDAINTFKTSGVTQLLIDLTNNPGGDVCLGQFLHAYLTAGVNTDSPGYVGTMRANTLARDILTSIISLGVTDAISFYAPTNFRFLNGTVLPPDFNYFNPPMDFVVNGIHDPTSQRHFLRCEDQFTQPIPQQPPFDLSKVAIIGNGFCGSTCAQFSSVMFERHNTKIAVFGATNRSQIEFKGAAGMQVLAWTDIDSEIKTANQKNHPLAPPDLLVNADMSNNWQTAWSFKDENVPLAYLSEQPTFRFAYTQKTYNNPENLWNFAATKMF